ncbi:MAG TPA: septal ring lytic transglycosylase RlpA family protein [Agitococcus sp.]|nr:septal ring lytic transglycosylase RlpA family protein [Agitococcus sp.]
MKPIKITLLINILILTACSTVQSNKNKNWLGYIQTGIASYYADKHQNQKTANGEMYQHKLKTAAHRSLPFGTNVKVVNIENNKSIVVKINDRGPFRKGRIIDLSKSAFMEISDTNQGLLKVQIEVVP